jgi:hypothetical protein
VRLEEECVTHANQSPSEMKRTGSAPVEFLPTDDPEARLFAADIIGYLSGYAHLINTRSLARSSVILTLARTNSFSPLRPLMTGSWIWSVRMRIWGATTSRMILRRPQMKRSVMLGRSQPSYPKMSWLMPA